MRGEDQPRLQGDEPGTAQAAEFHLLQYAQQLDLRKQAQIANLIQEQSAVVGLLEISFSRPNRSGEGALFMAKQLGLNQSLRDGAAGNSHKRTADSGAQIVDSAGDQLLAGSAFTGHQHCGV